MISSITLSVILPLHSSCSQKTPAALHRLALSCVVLHCLASSCVVLRCLAMSCVVAFEAYLSKVISWGSYYGKFTNWPFSFLSISLFLQIKRKHFSEFTEIYPEFRTIRLFDANRDGVIGGGFQIRMFVSSNRSLEYLLLNVLNAYRRRCHDYRSSSVVNGNTKTPTNSINS